MALLQTKFTIPITRPDLVIRERLWQRLNAFHHNKLVLVSAPAGFGKTTLVATYATRAAATKDTSVAWLTVSEADNDPARFWPYCFAALTAAGMDLSAEATAVSPSSAPHQIITDVVNGLTAVLASQPNHQLILVLDDYHLLHNNNIHQAITFLLEHMPAQMRLILTSRADPPLPLARWRAQSALTELRQQDLRFTPAEAADFLNRVMGLQLSAHDIATLNNRAEGWIAGLQMAAVSLQGRSDVTGFVQSFGGSHRYILDYLMTEVLSNQPEEVTQFLLQTAVLDRLTAPLCDAVLGIEDHQPTKSTQPASQQILEQLETANLFLVSLDDERRWYRYHRLFSDLLRQQLAQSKPTQIRVLHERAAAWYEDNGYLEEAIAHALSAGADDVAARLITQIAEAMLMRSELVTVMRWLTALPEVELAKRPSLCIYYAWALIMEGQSEAEVEKVLQHVAAEGAPGELSLVKGLLAILRGDGTSAIKLSQQAISQLAPDRTFLRGVAAWVLGLSFLFHNEFERGIETLEQAVQIGQQVGNMTIAIVSLGRLARQAWRDGDLVRAKRYFDQALVFATDEEERPLPIAGESHIGLASIYFEWNEFETAVQHLEIGLTLTERWREMTAMSGYIILARIRQNQGDPEAVEQALHQARQIALHSKGTQLDDMAVGIAEASLRLQQGETRAVEAWCAERRIPPEIDADALRKRDDLLEGHMRKYEFIILARLRLAQQRPDEALVLLPPLLVDAQRLQRVDLQIEIKVLMALCYLQQEKLSRADQYVQEALTLAEPGGFIRLFVQAGTGIEKLLARQQPTNENQQKYLQKLLAACGQPVPDVQPSSPSLPSPLIEPLSERELEVLGLIADGMSNREIAAELVLSLPTIKWHTSNIYGKLGVRNRTTAVARARELDILA